MQNRENIVNKTSSIVRHISTTTIMSLIQKIQEELENDAEVLVDAGVCMLACSRLEKNNLVLRCYY